MRAVTRVLRKESGATPPEGRPRAARTRSRALVAVLAAGVLSLGSPQGAQADHRDAARPYGDGGGAWKVERRVVEGRIEIHHYYHGAAPFAGRARHWRGKGRPHRRVRRVEVYHYHHVPPPGRRSPPAPYRGWSEDIAWGQGRPGSRPPGPRHGSGSGGGAAPVVGGIVGATIGGFLGSQVGRGDGRVAATAAATLAGFLLGTRVGEAAEDPDYYR